MAARAKASGTFRVVRENSTRFHVVGNLSTHNENNYRERLQPGFPNSGATRRSDSSWTIHATVSEESLAPLLNSLKSNSEPKKKNPTNGGTSWEARGRLDLYGVA